MLDCPSMSSEPQETRDPAELSFEDAASELESIIDRIESGEVGLEESLKHRRRGEALLTRCRSILDTAEKEIERLDDDPQETGGGEG